MLTLDSNTLFYWDLSNNSRDPSMKDLLSHNGLVPFPTMQSPAVGHPLPANTIIQRYHP